MHTKTNAIKRTRTFPKATNDLNEEKWQIHKEEHQEEINLQP